MKKPQALAKHTNKVPLYDFDPTSYAKGSLK